MHSKITVMFMTHHSRKEFRQCLVRLPRLRISPLQLWREDCPRLPCPHSPPREYEDVDSPLSDFRNRSRSVRERTLRRLSPEKTNFIKRQTNFQNAILRIQSKASGTQYKENLTKQEGTQASSATWYCQYGASRRFTPKPLHFEIQLNYFELTRPILQQCTNTM